MTTDEVVARLRAAGCVFAEDEAALLLAAAASPEDLEAMVAQRVTGLPLEQILGWAEFAGLRVAIDPGVFVPRRRTELLVAEGSRLGEELRAGRADDRVVVVDLCCGSGALGLAVARVLGDVQLVAADVDPAAVRCARRNLDPVGGRVVQGDLDEPVPSELRGHVDLLLANAPYVPTGAIGSLPPEARDHEPIVALDGGADGLDVLRRVVDIAPGWLAPGGHVLFETSDAQSGTMAAAVVEAGLTARVVRDDETGATVVIGTAPHRPPVRR